MIAFTPTIRTRLIRKPDRAVYDRERVHAILDEGYVCHVGFVSGGQPYVIPTAYGRSGDKLYIHGSAASRMLRTLGEGISVCVTVTLVDGLVLARAAFRHSMNYRSVVILGTATPVTDPSEKAEALRCFTNHLIPGRWEELREVTDKELAATSVLSLPLNEVSAKMRSGPPLDNAEDLSEPKWAGVIPISMQLGEPIPDDHVMPGIPAIDTRRLVRAGA